MWLQSSLSMYSYRAYSGRHWETLAGEHSNIVYQLVWDGFKFTVFIFKKCLCFPVARTLSHVGDWTKARVFKTRQVMCLAIAQFWRNGLRIPCLIDSNFFDINYPWPVLSMYGMASHNHIWYDEDAENEKMAQSCINTQKYDRISPYKQCCLFLFSMFHPQI